MDNLSAHEVERTRWAIEVRGAELVHLSANSSDLDPIKPLFSKLKTLLHRRPPEPSTTRGQTLARCWTASNLTCAPLASAMADMTLPDRDPPW